MINTEAINNSDPKYSSYKYIIKELFPYLWINDWSIRLRIVSCIFLMVFKLAVNFGTLYAMKSIIDNLVQHNNSMYLIYFWVLAYGFLWMGETVVDQLRYFIMYRVLERGMRLLGQRIFDQLMILSLKFHSDRQTGAITTALNRAHKGFYSIFMAILEYTIPAIIEITTAIATLWYLYGYSYSGILFLTIIVYFAFTMFGIKWIIKYQNEYIKKDTQAGVYLVDKLLNYETIKFFNTEKYETNQCNNILKERENTGTARYEKETLLTIGQWVILGLGLIVITFLSGQAVLAGQITIGDFTLINGYIVQFAYSENNFGNILYEIRNGFNDMSYIMALINKKSDIVEHSNSISLNINKPLTIKFENVSFGYDTEKTILNNISFNISAGKTIALVGPSGVGKSTILKLLFKFYNVQSGQIKINDHNINNITQESLHRIIGIVPQDTVLFNDTIYYNIAYGKPNATKKDIEIAAKMANLDWFIDSLPEGYNTIVGERGFKLSGGEKQRLAIARIALKQPQIYIFDEATSALDSYTENEIQKNFQKISQHATTLIISHRLSTVINVDEIFVINNGQIVEFGAHQALLNKQGFYSELWKLQQLEI